MTGASWRMMRLALAANGGSQIPDNKSGLDQCTSNVLILLRKNSWTSSYRTSVACQQYRE